MRNDRASVAIKGVREKFVVSVQKSDKASRRDANPGIPHRRHALVRLLQYPDARVRDEFLQDFSSAIGRSVIDDNNLVRRPELFQAASDRPAYVVGTVKYWNDDRDGRPGCGMRFAIVHPHPPASISAAR